MAKILAVDDEAKILQIIRKALEKDGHIVQTVQDGEVVRQMELSRYDLILLDVMMPGIDGFTLCREIRETVDCPIVFLKAKKVMAKDQKVPLTKSEYQICEYLALHHGQTLSREQIYEAVFGYEGESDASAITEHIKNIRAKLIKVQAEPIETVWGMGYRWN